MRFIFPNDFQKIYNKYLIMIKIFSSFIAHNTKRSFFNPYLSKIAFYQQKNFSLCTFNKKVNELTTKTFLQSVKIHSRCQKAKIRYNFTQNKQKSAPDSAKAVTENYIDEIDRIIQNGWNQQCINKLNQLIFISFKAGSDMEKIVNHLQAIYKKNEPQNSPSYINFVRDAGYAFQKSNPAKSQQYFVKCYEILRKYPGSKLIHDTHNNQGETNPKNHIQVIIAHFYERNNNPDKALEWTRKFKQNNPHILQRMKPTDQILYYFRLAVWQKRARNKDQILKCFKKCCQILEKNSSSSLQLMNEETKYIIYFQSSKLFPQQRQYYLQKALSQKSEYRALKNQLQQNINLFCCYEYMWMYGESITCLEDISACIDKMHKEGKKVEADLSKYEQSMSKVQQQIYNKLKFGECLQLLQLYIKLQKHRQSPQQPVLLAYTLKKGFYQVILGQNCKSLIQFYNKISSSDLSAETITKLKKLIKFIQIYITNIQNVLAMQASSGNYEVQKLINQISKQVQKVLGQSK